MPGRRVKGDTGSFSRQASRAMQHTSAVTLMTTSAKRLCLSPVYSGTTCVSLRGQADAPNLLQDLEARPR